MASTETSKSFKLLNGGPLDGWWGPYANVTAACIAIPNQEGLVDGIMVNFREGKVVGIKSGADGIVEYCWQKNYTDAGLVKKVGETVNGSITNEKLADGSVSLNKATFKYIGKNKFNKGTVSVGYISSNTGAIDPSNATYDTSDFIAIIPSTRYVSPVDVRFRAYYDANRTLIPMADSGPSKITNTPATAFFTRLSFVHTALDTFQFEPMAVGSSSSYEPYTLYMDPAILEAASIGGEKMKKNTIGNDVIKVSGVRKQNTSFFAVGKNLFNPKDLDIKRGFFLGQNGGEAANAAYSITGYMLLSEGQSVINSLRTYGASTYTVFYDINKQYIDSTNLSTLPAAAAPAGTVYFRDTLVLNATDDITTKTIQIELGTVKTTYEPYLNALTLDSIPKEVIKKSDLNSLPDAIITPKNTTFFDAGMNLIDVNDPDFKPLNYIGGTGGFSPSIDYNTSGFIRIDRLGRIYTSNNGILVSVRFITFFDANKVAIPASYQQNVSTIEFWPGALYFRVSYKVTYTSFQVEIATSFSKIYLPFEFGVASKWIPSTVARDKIDAFLPKEYCVLLGTKPLEIYNNEVAYCGNYSNFNFQWAASTTTGTIKSIGSMVKNKFTVDASFLNQSLVGVYTLTLVISDNNNNIMFSLSSILRVVNVVKVFTEPIYGHAAGDSLTNKPTLPETRNNLKLAYGKEALRWVGKKPYTNTWGTPADQALYCNHEGFSGYRQDQFLNAGYGGGIKIMVSGVVVAPAPKKQYRFNSNNGLATFEVEDVFNQNGDLYSSAGGVITSITLNVAAGQSATGLVVAGQTTGGSANGVSAGVAGDSTLNYSSYTLTGGNPYWNPNTNAVDFPWYFSSNNLPVPAFFRFMLGTNAITDIASLVTLVNLVQTQLPGMKVFVFLPQYPGNYLIAPSIRKLWFEFVKNASLAFLNTANVHCVPIAHTHDSENNYYTEQKPINPFNTNLSTWIIEDYTHPQQSGYKQMSVAETGHLAAYIYN
jgi:hypothetical protein